MTNREVDDSLKRALSSQEMPSEILNRRILKKAKEIEMKKKNRSKRWASIAAAAAIFLGVSTTALAAYHLLNAPSVAEELNGKLAEPFETRNILDEEWNQKSGPYEVTLLGVLTGEKLDEEFCRELGITQQEKTYAAVAIAKTDGSSMQEEEGTKFFISPLIEGLDPAQYNIITMNMSGSGISWSVINGIMYYIVDCDDITCFADRKVYLAVLDQTFYSQEAYAYDESTGSISSRDSYNGMNLLFELPLDKALADTQRAGQYLQKLEESWQQENADSGAGTEEYMSAEEVLEKGSLREDSIKEITQNDAGEWHYEYDFGSIDGLENKVEYSSETPLFLDNESGYRLVAETEDPEGHTAYLLAHKDENGKITGMIYEID